MKTEAGKVWNHFGRIFL